MPDPRGRQPAARHAYLDLGSLLHPSGAFAHPYQVVDDPDLTLSEKHAILAAWAADARSARPKPVSAASKPVKLDDILAALREVGEQVAHGNRPRPHYRRILNMRGRSDDRKTFS